jgi:hypothetical protein
MQTLIQFYAPDRVGKSTAVSEALANDSYADSVHFGAVPSFKTSAYIDTYLRKFANPLVETLYSDRGPLEQPLCDLVYRKDIWQATHYSVLKGYMDMLDNVYNLSIIVLYRKWDYEMIARHFAEQGKFTTPSKLKELEQFHNLYYHHMTLMQQMLPDLPWKWVNV